MIDINYIRNNPIEFDNYLKSRGINKCSKQILKIDEDKRNTQTVLQQLLAEKNSFSKEIGILKTNNKNVDSIIKKVELLKDKIINLKELEIIKNEELSSILSRIPNIPFEDVPIGNNENDNLEIKKWGNKKKYSLSLNVIMKLVKILV